MHRISCSHEGVDSRADQPRPGARPYGLTTVAASRPARLAHVGVPDQGRAACGRLPRMTPPRWIDDDDRELPTRPCPACGRVIPMHRWAAAMLRAHGWHAYRVASCVTWCGHQQDVILVPQDDRWWGDIPVLGETVNATGAASVRSAGHSPASCAPDASPHAPGHRRVRRALPRHRWCSSAIPGGRTCRNSRCTPSSLSSRPCAVCMPRL